MDAAKYPTLDLETLAEVTKNRTCSITATTQTTYKMYWRINMTEDDATNDFSTTQTGDKIDQLVSGLGKVSCRKCGANLNSLHVSYELHKSDWKAPLAPYMSMPTFPFDLMVWFVKSTDFSSSLLCHRCSESQPYFSCERCGEEMDHHDDHVLCGTCLEKLGVCAICGETFGEKIDGPANLCAKCWLRVQPKKERKMLYLAKDLAKPNDVFLFTEMPVMSPDGIWESAGEPGLAVSDEKESITPGGLLSLTESYMVSIFLNRDLAMARKRHRKTPKCDSKGIQP
jgi:hypothetical protein